MNKTIIQLPKIKLVGISTRTSNAAEMDPNSAKIGATLQQFFANDLQNKIADRRNPGKVFAVYTDYENDVMGEYTYFLGEEVTFFKSVSAGLEKLTIPAQKYAQFTSETGPMPKVVIAMWQSIWGMDASDFGGQRTYIADFEVYDKRSIDPQNTALDIFIGI